MKTLTLLLALVVFMLFGTACIPPYGGPEDLQIVSPEGGESWQLGSIQTIAWAGVGSGNVNVYLKILTGENAGQRALLGGGGMSGTLQWRVGTTAYYSDMIVYRTGPYQIWLEVNAGIYDEIDPVESGVFNIIE